MKTKVITEVKSTEIDWSKVNLVRSISTELTILTNGNYSHEEFEGTPLVGDKYTQVGDYSRSWFKSKFTIITEPFTIEFNSK